MLALALLTTFLLPLTNALVGKKIAVPSRVAADSPFTVNLDVGCSSSSGFRVYLSTAEEGLICYLGDHSSSTLRFTLEIPAAVAADNVEYVLSVKEFGGRGGLAHSGAFAVTGGGLEKRMDIEERGLDGSNKPCVDVGLRKGKLELREERHGNGTNGGGDGDSGSGSGDNDWGDNDTGDDNGQDGRGDNDSGDDNGNDGSGDNDSGDDKGHGGPGDNDQGDDHGHDNSTTTSTSTSTAKSSTITTSPSLTSTFLSSSSSTTSSRSTSTSSSPTQIPASSSNVNKAAGLTWVLGLLLTQVLFWGL